MKESFQRFYNKFIKKNVIILCSFVIIFFLIFSPLVLLADDTSFLLQLTPADCGDGIDNDNDSLIDFPNDPGCTSEIDDNELNVVPPVIGGTRIPSSGGGGVYIPDPETSLIMSGYSFPNEKVSILKDGDLIETVTSSDDGYFAHDFLNIAAGNYLMTFYGIDSMDEKSKQLNVPLTVYSGMSNEVNNILIPPTISIDKSDIAKGENLIINGESIPNSTVILKILFDELKNECNYNCDDINFNVYLVNPDGLKINMNSAFTKITRQNANTTIVNFEDKGVDFDYNDVVIQVDKIECSKYKIKVLDYNANNIHQLRLGINYNEKENDILLWDNTKKAVNQERLIDTEYFLNLCQDTEDDGQVKYLEFFVPSDANGKYSYSLNTSKYQYGTYDAFAQTLFRNELLTIESHRSIFNIGFDTADKKDLLKGDLNADGFVNLVDFSILAFWYQKELSNEFKIIEEIRLNGDGIANLADFSLLAYYWTG